MASLFRSVEKEDDACFAGSLYEPSLFPFYWLLSYYLSRPDLPPDHEKNLRELADGGTVIYALKHKSQLDCLILRDLSFRKDIPKPLFAHSVNMMLWQPVARAWRAAACWLYHFLFKRKILRPNRTCLKKLVRDDRSAIIYLRNSGSDVKKDPLIQLMEAQREQARPVIIQPVLVSYGPRKEQEKPLIDVFFGEAENPGSIRKLLSFLRYHRRTSVLAAEPVNLALFMKDMENMSLVDVSYELRRELTDRIDREKKAIIGPVLKSRDEIMEETLKERQLVSFMKQLAETSKKKERDLVKRARRYLREIAADYNEVYVGIWDKFLTWLWNDIYDGVVVDKEGMARIRCVSKDMPFVIIPCHRSHVDYLLLSYVFDKNKIPLPFVAAGTNLDFWPLGHIFRKSGAFFIRRSFKGNLFYREVLEKYLKTLLKEGYPVEFFIEGGRSRTGKMVMPKYGLLSMVLQAYDEGVSEDLAIIPVFIGYDRVIEEKAYLKELGGAPKEKEKPTAVIQSSKFLGKRYGRVYVNVGEPLFLKAFLASQEKPFREMTVGERQSLYRKIGYETMNRISKVSVVTPSALVAASLLCQYRRGLSHEDLLDIIAEFYDYLSFNHVALSTTFAQKERAINDAVNLFIAQGVISKIGGEEEEEGFEEIVYSLDDEKRPTLEYYKNNILHFFLPLAFAASSILSFREDAIPLISLMEDYKFFKRIFRREFIFDSRKDDAEEIREVLSYLYGRRMIIGEERNGEAWIEVSGRGRRALRPFAGLVHNYIESYWIVMRAASALRKEPKSGRDFNKLILRMGAKMFRKGEVIRAEALSQANYESALRVFRDEGIFREVARDEKKDLTLYSLTENRKRVESVRQRLFRFL
jgi:glycerol-3-phosphate O-acyltransferase